MPEVFILNTALSIISLLLVSTAVSFLLRNSNFPYTVALVLTGIIVGFGTEIFEPLNFLSDFRLSPELVFYVFLPTLIFESAFHIQFKHFKQNAVTIFSLSTIGMLMSTGLVGLGMHYLIGLPWATSLIFGALISATDPISVLALFKKIGAPKRLSTIVEGESLFNDAVALVLFGILVEGHNTDLLGSFENFGRVVVGGLLTGAVLGFLFSKALDYVRNSKEIEITLTLILAHSTFIIGEYFFGVSGILATVMAGLIIGNYGAFKISRDVKVIMEHFWDYSAYLANSILFLMVGLIIFESNEAILPLLLPLAAVIAITLLARMIMVYTILPAINVLIPKERVPFQWMHIIQWSGLRGALAIALILTIPPNFPHYEELLIYTIGVIFFTITFNGLTITPMLSWFKLKKLSTMEIFEHEENIVLIDRKVDEKLKLMRDKKFISDEIYNEVNDAYEDQCRNCTQNIQDMIANKKLNKTQLHSILRKHLLGIERRTFKKLYYNGEITQDLLNILINNIEKQLEKNDWKEKTELGRLTYLNADGKLVQLLVRLGWESLPEKIRRKEVMLRYEMFRARSIAISKVQHTLREIRKTRIYLSDEILEEHEERYKKWGEKAKEKLKALQKEDPKSCRAIEVFLAKQAAFQTEEKTIKHLNESGMNSSKVHKELLQNLDDRQRNCPL